MQPNRLNAIAAIRASTPKQGTDGDSPESQREQIYRFAETQGMDVKETFIFLESGSKDIQPMQQAINYCKDPKNNIQVMIIKSIDRFTRGGSWFYDNLKMQLDNVGVALVDIYGIISYKKVNTLEHLNVEYKWSVYSPSKKAEILEAERAKDEIRDIMSRMIGAQIRYARMGYWVRRPLFGFDNQHIETRDGKRCVLVPNEDEAPWVRMMFELRKRGTLEDQEIVDKINISGYKTRVRVVRDKTDPTKIIDEIGDVPLTLKVFWKTIENPVYAGVNPEKWTQGNPVRTKFKGLVSVDDFNIANRGKIKIIENGEEVRIERRLPAEYLVRKGVKNIDFPYKKVVLCPKCGLALYGSASRGKSGEYFPAYHCNRKGHYFRVAKKEFEATVTAFVESVAVNVDYADRLIEFVTKEWQRRQGVHEDESKDIEKRLQGLKRQSLQIVDKMKFLSSGVALRYMEEDLMKTDSQIQELEQQLKAVQPKDLFNMEKIIAGAKYFLEHLVELLLHRSNPLVQAANFGLLFNQLPTYDELQFGTPENQKTPLINEMFMQKKSIFGLMAGDEGFEPPIVEPESTALPLGQSPIATPNFTIKNVCDATKYCNKCIISR